ncbi:DUF4189 domain-containing protein [Mycobacterium sp. NBC_00419]|uniref:hypothetical protein n=1 Tax=Mycobacterium sp. NBC_00419 TaxID=2975989 RepID=UPI002E24B0AB
MHRIAAANFGVLASAAMMWNVATPVAHASPEDPYGNDWVALAIAPFAPGTPTKFGIAGTQDEAVRIAMDFCNKGSSGYPCYVGSTTEYGCVAVVINHRSGSFSGGRGPDLNSAIQDAANGTATDPDPHGFEVAGAKCSEPSTPPT